MFLYILPIICACIIVATSFGSRQILPLSIDGITNDRALDYITLSFAFAVGQVIWGFANYVGGMVADRFGDEKALFLGIILSAIGCYLIQYCDSTFGDLDPLYCIFFPFRCHNIFPIYHFARRFNTNP